jgi:hypothetical protein
MKLTFHGWRREVKPHERPVFAVKKSGGAFRVSASPGPLVWEDGLTTYGKLKDLGLSGNFLVRFDFSAEDLEAWLIAYAEAEPKQALRLVSEALREITNSLAAEG